MAAHTNLLLIEHRRECRCGAGKEATPGLCDTPGYKLQDQPTIDIQRKAKKLFLSRNHERLTQSSTDLLRSWRANCDVQLLIYDSDPSNPNLREITRVIDYVVGYTCKGGTTLQEERQTNKHLARQAETITGDNMDLKILSTKIMNKAASNRLISRQEASVLLCNLPLTLSSEFVNHVPCIMNLKITKDGIKVPKSSLLYAYSQRKSHLSHLSLYEFFKHQRKEKKLSEAIPHFTGISGTPCFPVTKSYARHALLVHKPWTSYPTDWNWLLEFDQFINSKDVPKAARMAYDRVVMRHYDGTKFVDPVAKTPEMSNDISDEDYHTLILCGLSGNSVPEMASLFDGIEKGNDFAWDAPPIVSVFCAIIHATLIWCKSLNHTFSVFY